MVKKIESCVPLLTLLLVVGSAMPLAAQDIYWTGGVGGFDNAANWDLFVPDSFSTAHIGRWRNGTTSKPNL